MQKQYHKNKIHFKQVPTIHWVEMNVVEHILTLLGYLHPYSITIDHNAPINVYHPLGPAGYNCHFPMFDLPNPILCWWIDQCGMFDLPNPILCWWIGQCGLLDLINQLTIDWMCITTQKLVSLVRAHASH